LRNISGVLTGSPLGASSTVAPTNHQQHLFYGWRDRLVAALMHEYVIVPEGSSDCAWLDTLETAIELRQTWQGPGGEPTRFGTFVGVTPTVDARVADTYGIAQAVHGNVLCLVDGDPAGLGYVGALQALNAPPRVVFAWPDGWCMEDVIVWFADASWATASAAIGASLGETVVDGPSLRTHLLAHKNYAPLAVAVAEALAGIPACRTRISNLLNDIADIARNAPGARTHVQADVALSTPQTAVWRLVP
jgi:putative ATP-dependent endonuclease of the OLD family